MVSKITQSARGKNCTIRLPNVCNHNNETTIFAHINGIRFGHGVGIKVNDMFGAYSCSDCHDAVDGRAKTMYTKDELHIAHLEGILETMIILHKEGLIKT